MCIPEVVACPVTEHVGRAVVLALSTASGDVSLHDFTSRTEVSVAGLLGAAISKYELSLALVQPCESNVVAFSSDCCLIRTAPLGTTISSQVALALFSILFIARVRIVTASFSRIVAVPI